MERIIYLQKIGELDQSLLITLKSHLERELNQFNIRVKINMEQITLKDSEYNNSNKQLNGLKIINQIKREWGTSA